MKPLLAIMALMSFRGAVYGQYILTPPQAYPFFPGYSARPLGIEDINNDNYLDLTMGGNFGLAEEASPPAILAVAFNNGSGNFGSWQEVSRDNQGTIKEIEYNFLRGTTERDLVATYSTHTEVLWNINNTLTVQQTNLPAGTVLSLGRVDNDINDDLVLVTGSTIQIFQNNGTGTFIPTPIQTISEQPIFIRLADLNDDDIFHDLITRVGSTVKVRKNTSGAFGSPTNINLGNNALAVEISDVNNDNYPDLVAINDDYLKIYLNDAQGNIHTTPDQQIYNSQYFNFLIADIALGDMNNDGWNDLVIAYHGGELSLWINRTSSPSFQDYPSQITAPIDPSQGIYTLALADVENIGGLAVGLSAYDIPPAGYAYIFKHDGNPAPAPPRNLTVSGQAGQHPTLQWEPNSERDLAQYKIYKSYSSFGGFTFLATVPSTQIIFVDISGIIITGLPQANERRAYYKITAVDNQSQESNFSNIVNMRVQGLPQEKISAGSSNPAGVSDEYVLLQNYPNPFNPATTIQFGLKEAGAVEVTVYSLSGQKVATLSNGFMEAGTHQLQWDGKDQQGKLVSSGMYLYQLRAGDQRLTKKMMLVR